ncbi:MAG: hypothetical protein ACOCTG_02835 [Bacteroidota bacterium]
MPIPNVQLFRVVLFTALLLLVAACETPDTPPPEVQETVPPDRVATDADTASWAPQVIRDDEEKLLLIEDLPLGSNYEDVRALFPAVGPEEPEQGLEDEALSRAFLPVSVLGNDATLEFNFRDTELYSYFYRIEPIDCSDGAELYGELQNFYQERYGEPEVEQTRENVYTARSSFWRDAEERADVAMTLGQQVDECRLSWGFQTPAAY